MKRFRVAYGLVATFALGWVFSARADRIQLVGGGEMKGVVVPDPLGREGMVGVLTERSARPLPLKREQIGKIIEEAGPLRDYLSKRDETPHEAEAHHELALWCEERKLAGPAEIEFKKAIEIDPTYGPSRKKLGHVQVGDEWMTPAEARQAKGLVLHKGKWVTPEERDRRDADEAGQNDGVSWTRRLQALKLALRSEKPDVRRQAEDQIAQISEVAAIGPLVKVFGKEGPQGRILLFRTLDKIEGPEASAAILNQYLAEPDPAVHALALDIVVHRPKEHVQPRLLQTLKSNRPDAISQSALALSELKAEAAIPQLVNSLFQYRDRTTWVPVEVPRVGPSFVSGRTVTYAANAVPVVAPGAVAYQVIPNTLLDGVAMGGNSTSVQMMPTTVRDMLPNEGVHEALVKLSGQDFGYNTTLWKQWLATGRRIELPERRVPGP